MTEVSQEALITLFQFLMVRLKALGPWKAMRVLLISIPYGSIKRGGAAIPADDVDISIPYGSIKRW